MKFDFGYIFPALIISGLAIYGIYMVYTAIRSLKSVKEAKERYINNSKQVFEKESDYAVWNAFYGLLFLGGIAGFIYGLSIKDYVTGAAFLFVSLYSISLMIEVMCRRTIYVGEENFLYENLFVKYRSVRDVEVKGSVIKTCEVRTTTSPEPIKMPKKYGILVKEKSEAFKESHKRNLKRR